MKTISFEVDAGTAQEFSDAPPEVQRKLRLLLGIRLRELTRAPARPLSEVMDDIGRRAEAHGVTSEILRDLMRDE